MKEIDEEARGMRNERRKGKFMNDLGFEEGMRINKLYKEYYNFIRVRRSGI